MAAVYEPASKLSAMVHVVPFAFVVQPADDGVSAALSATGGEHCVHPATGAICTQADCVDAETYCARRSADDVVPVRFGMCTTSAPRTAADVCVTEGVTGEIVLEDALPHPASVAHSSMAIEQRVISVRLSSERRGR